MTLHQGKIYQHGIVTLRSPKPDLVLGTQQADDVRESVEWWLSQATQSEQIYYFSVFDGEELVGQILLHDIDKINKEALIAYHLFQPRFRGHGIGAQMLELLKHFVRDETDLSRIIIITSRDNAASQRVAEKCDFKYTGTSREDPVNGVVYEWRVPSR